MKLTKRILVAAITLPLLGCSAVNISAGAWPGSSACPSEATDCSTKRVDGIPFNVKVPTRVQTTKYAAESITVAVDLKTADGKKSKPFAGSPVYLLGTSDAKQRVAELQKKVSGVGVIQPEVLAEIVSDLKVLGEMARDQSNNPPTGQLLMIANTVKVEARLSERQYYYDPRMPLIGTVNASIDLAPADGTMSKASIVAEDKTLSTIISALPVKEVVSKALGVAIKTETGPSYTKVELATTEGELVYTLTRAATSEYPCTNARRASESTRLVPLTLEDGHSGNCGVQQVIERPGATNPKSEEKTLFGISGKITQPEQKGE